MPTCVHKHIIIQNGEALDEIPDVMKWDSVPTDYAKVRYGSNWISSVILKLYVSSLRVEFNTGDVERQAYVCTV